MVVGEHPAARGGGRATLAVNGGHHLVEYELEAGGVEEPVRDEGELVLAGAAEGRRQGYPVVGRAGLLAYDGHLPGVRALEAAGGDQLLDQPVAHHAVTGDHEVPSGGVAGCCGAGHAATPTGASAGRGVAIEERRVTTSAPPAATTATTTKP